MSDLKSISGIGKSSLELLEAAGFLDVKSLAAAGVDELTAELERANRILGIAKRPPSRASVEKWIQTARTKSGLPPAPKAPKAPKPAPSEKTTTAAEPAATTPPANEPDPARMPVNHEGNPEVAALLERAPLAIPLPARHLMEHRIGVSDIPPAILLNRYSGDLECRVDDRLPRGSAPRAAQSNQYVQTADSTAPKASIDPSRFRSMAELGERRERLPASTRNGEENAQAEPRPLTPAEERLALLRAPREETNRGRDPKSRRYVRGVLHSHPWSITTGAVVTLLLFAWTPLAISAALLLLLSDLMPDRFAWVQPWWLVFPVALPLIGLSYLIWGLHGSCRICGQKLFMPKSCLKNRKAHHVPGLGHIIPLCFHLLCFRWFRCTHCGTPVRLKK